MVYQSRINTKKCLVTPLQDGFHFEFLNHSSLLDEIMQMLGLFSLRNSVCVLISAGRKKLQTSAFCPLNFDEEKPDVMIYLVLSLFLPFLCCKHVYKLIKITKPCVFYKSFNKTSNLPLSTDSNSF